VLHSNTAATSTVVSMTSIGFKEEKINDRKI